MPLPSLVYSLFQRQKEAGQEGGKTAAQINTGGMTRIPSAGMRRLTTHPARNVLSRKEVFQPHLPVRLPCYDLAPITRFTLGRSSRSRTSGTPDFHGLTGGVYKARERIHRAMADARLLANPASWGRVADPSPN